MYAYIKSRAAFRNLWLRDAVDYDLTLDSLEAATSTMTLLGGGIPRSVAEDGDFLLIGDTLFLISLASPGTGVTELQLVSPLEAFSRPRSYTPPGEGVSVGEFIAAELAAGWRDEPDAAYAMPYLQIECSDRTPFLAPEPDASGLYCLSDYIRTVRTSLGVEVVFLDQDGKLLCRIRKAAAASHTLVCGNGRTFLEDNSYSRTAVAKVSTYQPVDTGQVDETTGAKIFETQRRDWYLAADGTVSDQEPAGRASGEWATVTVSEKKDAREAAEAVFAKNGETHKVEFWTDTRLHVGDRFRLRLPSGEVFEGVLSSVGRRRGDRRWLNRAGSLPVNLTDKVRSATGAFSTRGSGASASAQLYAVGDIFLTTREGDPATLLGYGAWDRIAGRYLLAADASRPVGSRGGEAEHTLAEEELPPLSLPVKFGTNRLIPTATSAAVATSTRYLLQTTIGEGSLSASLESDNNPIPIQPPYFAVFVWIRRA